MQPASEIQQLAGKAPAVARILGVSPSTVRRLSRTDPSFPRPFRLTERGDWLWPLTEIPGYLARKAGRQLAA
jgi:predicted DNA-binding transcriptional regulator AlpA